MCQNKDYIKTIKTKFERRIRATGMFMETEKKMKFGKVFKKQMVPEWGEAYIDYSGLKCMLKEIKRSKLNVQSNGDVENLTKGAAGTEDQENSMAEICLPAGAEETEIMLFKKLDDELEKVSSFYEGKVNESREEGNALMKQVDVLIALRKKAKEPGMQRAIATAFGNEECDKAISKPASTSSSDDGLTDEDEQKPDPSEVIRCVGDDPNSNVKEILEEFEAKNLNFNKEVLREVEARLKLAFLDFCQEIHNLKQYSFMNLSVFSEILKKYNQIASTSTRQQFMKKVESSYLGNSDEITDLLNRVEDRFAKHFSSYSKSKEGKRLLRPKQKRDKHSLTFLSGFLFGCSVALLVAAVLLVQQRKLLDKENAKIYMDNIFPLYSLYAFIILHMLVHAADIYFWRRYRINYPFIFGFEDGTELGYREIFIISSTLAVLVLSTFLVQLHIIMDTKIQENENHIELIPLVLLIVVVLIIFCPFNIFFRSTRFFLIRCFFRSACAPFFKVTLADFYVADQLTSQVQSIRNLLYYVCFYGWRNATQKQMKCQSFKGYISVYYVLSVVPYWFRFLQCVRRLIEEKKMMQGYTAVRFLVTVMAVVFQTVRKRTIWKVLGLVATVVMATMNTHADIVLDWGLLRWKSKKKLLRDKLLVPHKSVYFIAIVVDVVLRFVWLQLLLDFDMHPMHRHVMPFMITVLEILRRGIWNFFWLENEQVNNVGKYRAFKCVPPPALSYSNKHHNNSFKDETRRNKSHLETI